MAYVPDERKRYKPVDCEDQDTDYPRWIVEAWDCLLDDYFRAAKDPEKRARGAGAVVRKPTRRDAYSRDYAECLERGAEARPRCSQTLQLRALSHTHGGSTRLHLDRTIQQASEGLVDAGLYRNPQWRSGPPARGIWRQKLLPQTLSGLLWRHYLHPQEKSLGPGGEHCHGGTRGLLGRRPLKAIIPFNLIGKEVERKAQEGEDVSVLENTGPIRYHARRRAKTRPADPELVLIAAPFGVRPLMRESGASQHSVQRFLAGEPVHPATRARLERAVEKHSA